MKLVRLAFGKGLRAHWVRRGRSHMYRVVRFRDHSHVWRMYLVRGRLYFDYGDHLLVPYDA